MEHFLSANDIEEESNKKAILLSSCGTKTYSLLRSLVGPSKPGTKTFKQLADVMTAHQNPKPSVIMERYRFNKRDRESCESIAQYVAALRKQCKYDETLTDMIRERLVCDIRDDRIQQRIKITTSMKQAKNSLENIHKSQDLKAAVMKVQAREKSTFSGSCYELSR